MHRILSMALNHKLMMLCDSRGWTRYKLQGIVGKDVSRSTIDNWWKGSSRPSLETALKIAKEFKVPLEWLADDEMDEPPPSELREDERTIIRLLRSRGLTLEEVVDRLYDHPGIGTPGVGLPGVDPGTGQPLAPETPPRKSRTG